jgi:hypothetical protein
MRRLLLVITVLSLWGSGSAATDAPDISYGILGRAGGRLGCGRECVSLCPKPRWDERPAPPR